ncbi:molybdopterin-guanine dinucleotide biosynthesis protein MobB [Bacillus cereus]|nr:molybdopterin-guanine dinucleotide biosynthesis protein MobB [Bacillus cereus]
MIKLYHLFSVDIIFVEGYKKKSYPKVVLIRDEDYLSLLHSLVNVRCVISHVQLDSNKFKHYQFFSAGR